MNRIIKFRALVKYPNKKSHWIYYEPLTIPHAFYAQNDDNPLNRAEIIVKNLEWTGLKDKNGKDIYESDLVKEGKKVFKVFWNDLGSGSWWFSSYTKDKEWLHVSKVNVSQLEVIGNIYKNKDLLK